MGASRQRTRDHGVVAGARAKVWKEPCAKLMALKELDIPLVLLGRYTRAESAQISTFAGFGVHLSGI